MPTALRFIAAGLVFVAAVFGPTAARAPARARQAGEATRDSLAIIVNRSNPVDNLSFAELRLYFLGERTHWPHSRRVQIVMRDQSRPERGAVLRLIYEMREQDFHAHFLRAKFTGETLEEPRLLDTTPRVINFVFLQPGAVGYVRAGEAGPSVKVLRVDGLLPGDAGYKLTF